MILAANIGNTNLSIGLKDGGCINTIRHPIVSCLSKEDFTRVIRQLLAGAGNSVTDAIVSSVKPHLTKHLVTAIEELFTITPFIVSPSINMKLDLSGYETGQLGSDRIAVCEAAASKYDMPLIIFDFGTATTINVIDGNSHFIGGSILPGLMMGISALAKDTAQLPQVALTSQTPLIGRNTRECINSGAIFGAASMLDGMTMRIEKRLGQKATVVITGGNAKYVISACQTEVILVPDLLLEGLYILHESNS